MHILSRRSESEPKAGAGQGQVGRSDKGDLIGQGTPKDVTGPRDTAALHPEACRAGRGPCSPGCPGEERSDEGRPRPPLGTGDRKAHALPALESPPPDRPPHGDALRPEGDGRGGQGAPMLTPSPYREIAHTIRTTIGISRNT
jgi:hypothetical protein